MDVFDLRGKISIDIDEYMNNLQTAAHQSVAFSKALGNLFSHIDISKAFDKTSQASENFAEAVNDAGAELDDAAESAESAGESFDTIDGFVETATESVEELNETVRETGKETEKSSNNTKSFADLLKNGLANAAHIGAAAMDAVVTAIGATTAAAAAMTGVITKAISDFGAYGDNIDKQSQKFGISAKAYQEWDAVLQHSGTSIDSMSMGMRQLDNALAEGSDAFGALGLNADELASMDKEDVFAKTIEALQNVEDRTQRTALATKLFGRSAMELGPLLNTSAKDTQAMKDRVHELGGVLSDEAVKSAAEFSDRMQDFKTAVMGAKNSIVQEFMPSVSTMIDGFTMLVAGEEGAGDKITEGLAKTVSVLTEQSGKLVDAFASAFSKNGDLILNTLKTIVSSSIQTLVKFLPDVIKTVSTIFLAVSEELPNVMTTVFDSIDDIAKDIIPVAQRLVRRLFKVLVAELPKLSAAFEEIAPLLGKAFSKILNTVVKQLPNILKAVDSFLPALVDLVVSAIDSIAGQIPSILDALLEALPQILNTIATALADNVEPILTGVLQMIDAIALMLPDALPQLIDAIIKTLEILIPAVLEFIVEHGDDIIQTIADVLMAGVESIINVGSELVGALLGVFTNAEWGDTVAETVENFKKAVEKKWEDFIDMGGDLIGKIVEGFKNAKSGFTTAVTEWGDSVLETVSGIWEDIKTFWGGLYDKFKEMGSNIINGIVEGFKSKWEEVSESVKDFASFMVDDIKDRFGIASPSKVMRDKVGKFLADGIGVGFTSEMDKVAKDMNASLDGITSVDVDYSANVSGDASSGQSLPQTMTLNLMLESGEQLAKVTFPFIEALSANEYDLVARGY